MQLRQVEWEMRTRGPPVVRAIRSKGQLYLIEGTHRLRAATNIGIKPLVFVIADDTTDSNKQVPVDYGTGFMTVDQLRTTYIVMAAHNRPRLDF